MVPKDFTLPAWIPPVPLKQPPLGRNRAKDFTDLSTHEAGNKPHSLGTICHENNGVMSALTVTSPPTSLVCAIPGPTAAVTVHWKDSFLRLGADTGRRKTPGGRWARCWCKWAGTAISSILTSTSCCSVTTHFAEVIFHYCAEARAIQRQILALVSFRAA